MLRATIAIGACAVVFLAAACSSSSGGSTSGSPTHTGLGGGELATTGAAPTGGVSGTPAGENNGGGSTPAGVLDPCSLVTTDEVTGAIGKPMGPGVSQNDGESCAWQYTDPSDSTPAVSITLFVNEDPEVFREDQQGGLGAVAVSGVGDEAYFTPEGIMSSLEFRKGQQLFGVEMLVTSNLTDQFPADTQQAAEKAVATAALARIP